MKNDAEKAMNVLLQQPEVNKSAGITLIGHSEGTVLAPRIAINNPDKFKNIVLMATPALNLIKDNAYLNYVLIYMIL